MAVDAVPCGRGDDRRQAMIQPALVATLRTAAAAAGLCWDRWIWARADDGGLALLPADQPGPLLVDEFVRALDRTLAWLNSELPWDSRLRLRVAIHYGTAIPARNGWAGQGAAAVSRLLDSLPIRLALAAADEANLAVILSRQAFDDIVRPGGASLREPDFRLVAVTVKEYSAEAWLRVPSLRPDELVVDRTTVTAGDAAGDLPGPPGARPAFRAGAGTPPGIPPDLLVRPVFRAGAGTPLTLSQARPGKLMRITRWKRTKPYRTFESTPKRDAPSKSASDERNPAAWSALKRDLNRGGDGNRTRVQGFAGPCLNHSATPPRKLFQRPNDRRRRLTMDPESRGSAPTAFGVSERTTGFEPATLTLAR